MPPGVQDEAQAALLAKAKAWRPPIWVPALFATPLLADLLANEAHRAAIAAALDLDARTISAASHVWMWVGILAMMWMRGRAVGHPAFSFTRQMTELMVSTRDLLGILTRIAAYVLAAGALLVVLDGSAFGDARQVRLWLALCLGMGTLGGALIAIPLAIRRSYRRCPELWPTPSDLAFWRRRSTARPGL